MKQRALVQFEAEGFHQWNSAPEAREYLRHRHRHVFKYKIEMQLKHSEREIEFHDLLDMCKKFVCKLDYGPQSCETMAWRLIQFLRQTFVSQTIEVTVMEDGENGAVCKFDPKTDTNQDLADAIGDY